MIFDVDVIKDIWDLFDIIATALCGVVSLYLIYKCSAMLSDRKKKYDQEFNSLNYLVICINRYIKHLLGILSVINTKKKEINEYAAKISDELKFKNAFQIITPPMVNFEVRLSDYAFTVKNQPKILDYLLNYIENYSLVIHQIEMINNESYIILEKKVGSKESIKIASRYHINDLESNNLLKLKFSTCYTLSLLYLLLQTVQKYQNDYKYKGYTRIDFHESLMNKIIDAENFVTNIVGHNYWENDLEDEDTFKNQLSISNCIENHSMRESMMNSKEESICDNCERKIKLLYEQYKNSAEDVSRYISIICSIFYVSIITVYSQVANNFSILNKKFFIINFIISVSVFVLYEIHKMLLGYLDYKEKNKQWISLYKNEINISELENNVNVYNNNLYRYHVVIWKYIFVITMLCGTFAFISLIWGLCKL